MNSMRSIGDSWYDTAEQAMYVMTGSGPRRIGNRDHSQHVNQMVGGLMGSGIQMPIMQGDTATQQKLPLLEQLFVRMWGTPYASDHAKKAGFDFMQCAEAGDEIATFLVSGGQAVTLKDNKDLFPSDTLVTQLRLLVK